MSRRIWNTVATILTALAVGLGSAARGEDTIKIGYTDPLSGPFAVVGQQLLQQAQYAAARSDGNSSWWPTTTSRSLPRS